MHWFFDNGQHRPVRGWHDLEPAELPGQFLIIAHLGDNDGQSPGGTVRQEDFQLLGKTGPYLVAGDVDCSGTISSEPAGKCPGPFRSNDKTGRTMDSRMVLQLCQADQVDADQRFHFPADILQREHRRTGEGADLARAQGEDPSVTSLVAGIRFWF